jgi:hypothetical protein
LIYSKNKKRKRIFEISVEQFILYIQDNAASAATITSPSIY